MLNKYSLGLVDKTITICNGNRHFVNSNKKMDQQIVWLKQMDSQHVNKSVHSVTEK